MISTINPLDSSTWTMGPPPLPMTTVSSAYLATFSSSATETVIGTSVQSFVLRADEELVLAPELHAVLTELRHLASAMPMRSDTGRTSPSMRRYRKKLADAAEAQHPRKGRVAADPRPQAQGLWPASSSKEIILAPMEVWMARFGSAWARRSPVDVCAEHGVTGVETRFLDRRRGVIVSRGDYTA
ncbi:MAG: hypothetical protein JST54_34045 [Deltaproteobacteria bacterium]|nr:hypothetical protein [Deltaproteobacteria bacterium]